MAVASGATALGLVAAMPSGPGPIPETTIRDVARHVRARHKDTETFLLSSLIDAQTIAEQVNFCEPTTLQLVFEVDPAIHLALAELCPEVKRVQVVHVEDERALAAIERYEDCADAFLLDSGRPNAKVMELGGTGRTHDWAISTEFVRQSPLPVYLAGGLKPENVAEAIATAQPYGVDLCSGVRTNNLLDPQKLAAFMQARRSV